MGKVIAGALCKSCVRSKQLHLYSSANAVSVALLPGVSPWVYIRHEGVVASGSVPLFWGKIQLCKSPCWVLGLWFCWVFLGLGVGFLVFVSFQTAWSHTSVANEGRVRRKWRKKPPILCWKKQLLL